MVIAGSVWLLSLLSLIGAGANGQSAGTISTPAAIISYFILSSGVRAKKGISGTGVSDCPLDQKYFDLVAEELSQGCINSGLWARALAEIGVDDSRTKARYIVLRANEFREKDFAERAEAERKLKARAELDRNEAELKERARLKLQSEQEAKHAAARNATNSYIESAFKTLNPRLGTSIHVVDESRKLNRNIHLRKLIEEMTRQTDETIYYDNESKSFLPFQEFIRKVSELNPGSRG